MVTGVVRRAAAAVALCACAGQETETTPEAESQIAPREGSFTAVDGSIASDCEESVPDEWWLADYSFYDVTGAELSFTVSYWGLGSAETLSSGFSSCMVDGVFFACGEAGDSWTSEVQGVWTANTRVRVMMSHQWLGNEEWPQPCARVAQFTLAPQAGG